MCSGNGLWEEVGLVVASVLFLIQLNTKLKPVEVKLEMFSYAMVKNVSCLLGK